MATAYTTTSSGKRVDYNVSSDPTITARNKARAEGAVSPAKSTSSKAAAPTTYGIARGDTLSGIASRTGSSVSQLLSYNPQITNPNLIRAGDTLNLGPMGRVPSQPSTADAAAMASSNPYALPPQQPGTALAGLNAASGGAIATPYAPDPSTPPTQQDTLSTIYSLIGKQGEKPQRTLDVQKELKLDKKQQSLTKLENQYITRQRELELQRRGLIESPYSGTKAGLNRDLNTLNRQSAQELADIAIQKAVALNDYNTAFDIAQRKIDAEFEPIDQQIKALTAFYQLNQNDLTDKEKVMLSAQIAEQQAQANFERDKKLIAYRSSIEQAAIKAGDATNQSVVENQLATAKDALKNAKEFSFAAGRGNTWAEGYRQKIFGVTDYTRLETYANTLRASVLSLATDPAIKKFFGPQMSNEDVKLMTSAGTSLNPLSMGPKEFDAELVRLEDLFNRLSRAKGVATGSSGGAAPTGNVGTTSSGLGYTILSD